MGKVLRALLKEAPMKRLELYAFRLLGAICVAGAIGVRVHDLVRVVGLVFP